MGSPAWPASPGQPALRTGRSKSKQHFCPFDSRHWPLPGWLFGSEAFWACASDPPTKTASANAIATTAEKRTIKTSLLEMPPPPLRRLVIRSVTIIVGAVKPGGFLQRVKGCRPAAVEAGLLNRKANGACEPAITTSSAAHARAIRGRISRRPRCCRSSRPGYRLVSASSSDRRACRDSRDRRGRWRGRTGNRSPPPS